MNNDVRIEVPSPLDNLADQGDKGEKRQICIPLREEKGKYIHLIGYFYPEHNWVITPKGNWSVDTKLSSDGNTMIPGKNKAHKKRMHAAYNSKDFTYREGDLDNVEKMERESEEIVS